MFATYLKHLLAWLAFGYFYLKGLNTALTLSIDAQDDPSLLNTVIYCAIFIALSAHLLVKYEKLQPLMASVVISALAIGPYGHWLTQLLAPYSNEMNLALFLVLPLLTWLFKDFSKFRSKAE
ncbi:hypothetical protein ACFOEE_02150 [Pseudoalteromonas fenneropenaei]|uniref:Uncharacterized protein n=1 Tax=Pseudoalteromonas fenneropenaei TaxID=1737459 RepID=A0ABV7CFG3_9GAMM